MTTYLVVNTDSQSSDTIGHVVSRHRTVSAAEAAKSKRLADVERREGAGHYLPLTIVEYRGRQVGKWLRRSDVRISR